MVQCGDVDVRQWRALHQEVATPDELDDLNRMSERMVTARDNQFNDFTLITSE
jgi:hypothetical protein